MTPKQSAEVNGKSNDEELIKYHQLVFNIARTIQTDYANFYTKKNVAKYSAALGVAALAANTNFASQTLDEAVQHFHKKNIKNNALDRFLIYGKRIGEGRPLAILGLVTSSGSLVLPRALSKNVVTTWGSRVSRAYLLGALVMMLGQRITGASRPKTTSAEKGSRWRFFEDRNGISGHAFAGAVPMLVAADMADNPTLKKALIAASMLSAISRFNDDSHYISQVALGWYLARLSVDAVSQTNTNGF